MKSGECGWIMPILPSIINSFIHRRLQKITSHVDQLYHPPRRRFTVVRRHSIDHRPRAPGTLSEPRTFTHRRTIRQLGGLPLADRGAARTNDTRCLETDRRCATGCSRCSSPQQRRRHRCGIRRHRWWPRLPDGSRRVVNVGELFGGGHVSGRRSWRDGHAGGVRRRSADSSRTTWEGTDWVASTAPSVRVRQRNLPEWRWQRWRTAWRRARQRSGHFFPVEIKSFGNSPGSVLCWSARDERCR